jgi:hypothetical protein
MSSPAPPPPKLSRKQKKEKRARDSVGSANIATAKRPRSGTILNDDADKVKLVLEQALPFRDDNDEDISDLQTPAPSSATSAKRKKPRKSRPVADPESWLKQRRFIKE